MKPKRVWVPIELWEELQWNMWGDVVNRQRYLERAVIFTGNHRLYGRYMSRVTWEWPNSCLNALTDQVLNRRAWIGQAACALALHCPEDVTRQAWGLLTHEQRILANKEADRAIQSWEMRYEQSQRIRKRMDAPVLHQWHPRGSAAQGGGFRQGTILAGGGNCSFEK